jgi:hypothetical protein
MDCGDLCPPQQSLHGKVHEASVNRDRSSHYEFLVALGGQPTTRRASSVGLRRQAVAVGGPGLRAEEMASPR